MSSNLESEKLIHITQLIYLHEGMELDFIAFENVALPLLLKYGGSLILRVRPEGKAVIESEGEKPYEIHILSFPSEEKLQFYLKDKERQQVLHLKEKSIRSVLLIKGQKIG